MDGGWFYAVAVGRSPGIYRDCQEARSQVDGFPGGKWKKFGSRSDAQAFIQAGGRSSNNTRPRTAQQGGRQSPPSSSSQRHPGPRLNQLDYLMGAGNAEPPAVVEYYALYLGKWSGICSSRERTAVIARLDNSTKVTQCATFADAEECLGVFGMMVDREGKLHPDGSWTWAAYRRGRSTYEVPDPELPDSLVAFCDGSAIRNGEYGCHAAFACIFPHNRRWDVVRKVKGPFATSNRAEYLAALEAIKRANIEDPKHEKTLVIYSDSELLVNSMSKWVIDWMYDGWVTSTGAPVKNRDLLKLLLEARGNDRAVVFEHVRAHTGGQDWKSRWNDVADQAARNAARAAAQNAPPPVPRPRICMMPALAAFGMEPNIRTYHDLYSENDGRAMAGEDAAAAP